MLANNSSKNFLGDQIARKMATFPPKPCYKEAITFLIRFLLKKGKRHAW